MADNQHGACGNDALFVGRDRPGVQPVPAPDRRGEINTQTPIGVIRGNKVYPTTFFEQTHSENREEFRAEVTFTRTLEARVEEIDGDTGGTISTLEARVETNEFAIADLDQNKVSAGQLTIVEGSIRNDFIDADAQVTQNLEIEIQAAEGRAASARATLETQLSARIDTNENDIAAEITNRQQAIASEQQARASAIQTVQASVDGNTSSITTNATAIADIDGTLSASYIVNLDAGGVATLEGYANADSAGWIFTGDNFAIKTQGGSLTPFSVSGNTVTLTNVVIDTAQITNLDADNLAIGGVALENLQSEIIAQVRSTEPWAYSDTSDKGSGNVTTTRTLTNVRQGDLIMVSTWIRFASASASNSCWIEDLTNNIGTNDGANSRRLCLINDARVKETQQSDFYDAPATGDITLRQRFGTNFEYVYFTAAVIRQ